ncbi:MAG: tRNA epoxyqueuosine(34) reductase QueG [Pirellulaceae bacterium]
MPTAAQLTQSLRTEARRLGFELFGVCPAVQPTGFHSLVAWIEAGFSGEMSYFSNRQEAYSHPNGVLDGTVSLVMLGMRYAGVRDRKRNEGFGQIASYAAGTIDYHDLIRERLNGLGAFYTQQVEGGVWRGVVDTAPLLEREFSQLAGLGWQGKNTMLIHPQEGSYFFLAALLVERPLEYDSPFEVDHCGTCRRCIEACPTQAILEDRRLDARRCISYLTIELRNQVPLEFREQLGDWLFGCDVCQDVCPWNRFAQAPTNVEFHSTNESLQIDLEELLSLDEPQFRQRFRHTPMWRAKRRGLLRNACLVLGNQGDPKSIPALVKALQDEEPLVRGAAAWALGRFSNEEVTPTLVQQVRIETNVDVRKEIELALTQLLTRKSPANTP